MDTLQEIDVDMELIFLEDLSIEKTCESPFHEKRMHGHGDGPLSYVRFYCRCAALGVTIRCDSWLKGCSRAEFWTCATCEQTNIKSDEWFDILGPVE